MRLSSKWDLEKRTIVGQRMVHNDTPAESKSKKRPVRPHGTTTDAGVLQDQRSGHSFINKARHRITETMAAFTGASTPIQAALTSKRLIL